MFQLLEDLIGSVFIPKLLGREIPGKVERDLFSLPVRLGGLGLFNPTVTAIRQHACSLHTSSPLVDLIVSQIHDASSYFAIQIQLRSEVLAIHRKELQEFANNIYDQLPSELQSSVELACERGASNWLPCLPLRSHGFALYKSAFCDGLLLRYHWTPLACPTSCACGHDFTIDHCISCPKGGFPSLRHNEVRDLTAKMMSEVCNNVSIEPRLSHFLVKLFALRRLTQTLMLGLILLLMASGVEGLSVLFFDVRVFNPGAPSNHPFKSAYRRHEREKRRQYEQRVREVEHGHFTPLVFTTTGGMGDAAGQVYKRLAYLLTEKLDLSYGEVMGWIRCKLSFALVRSAIMCIRSARSRMHSPVFDAPLDVQIAEAHL